VLHTVIVILTNVSSVFFIKHVYVYIWKWFSIVIFTFDVELKYVVSK